MSLFRFEDLVIWQRGIKIGHTLVDIADRLERQHKYKFAEQLRNAALSISNNISEGGGSRSKREFAHFVNIAKRTTFENANMVIFFAQRDLIAKEEKVTLLKELATEARMLESFRKSLIKIHKKQSDGSNLPPSARVFHAPRSLPRAPCFLTHVDTRFD